MLIEDFAVFLFLSTVGLALFRVLRLFVLALRDKRLSGAEKAAILVALSALLDVFRFPSDEDS